MNKNKLSNKTIAALSCASVRIEDLPLPEEFEKKLEDYLDGKITEEQVMIDNE